MSCSRRVGVTWPVRPHSGQAPLTQCGQLLFWPRPMPIDETKPLVDTYMLDQPREPQGAVSACITHIWCEASHRGRRTKRSRPLSAGLTKQWHPDLHPGGANAGRRFREVISAYKTLSDPKSRFAYDARDPSSFREAAAKPYRPPATTRAQR